MTQNWWGRLLRYGPLSLVKNEGVSRGRCGVYEWHICTPMVLAASVVQTTRLCSETWAGDWGELRVKAHHETCMKWLMSSLNASQVGRVWIYNVSVSFICDPGAGIGRMGSRGGQGLGIDLRGLGRCQGSEGGWATKEGSFQISNSGSWKE